MSPFHLMIGTTIFKANSADILNPSRTFWHISAITWIITSSNQLLWYFRRSRCFFCLHYYSLSFNLCLKHLLSTHTYHWTFYCISFHITIPIIFFIQEHIGHLVRMSVSGYRGWRFEPRHQYAVSLNKTLYPHCFSRLSCEMSTRWRQPRD